MTKLQAAADKKGVTTLSSRAERIMNMMGFTVEEGEQLVASFSGGWKMRIGLGKILLTEPNILLLDEPTNHLDLESIEWMEDFLINQKIPMVGPVFLAPNASSVVYASIHIQTYMCVLIHPYTARTRTRTRAHTHTHTHR